MKKFQPFTSIALLLTIVFNLTAISVALGCGSQNDPDNIGFGSSTQKGTPTMLCSEDGIDMVMTNSAGGNINVSSGFADPGVMSSSTTWKITFSPAINIPCFMIGEFTNNTGNGNYVFTVTGGNGTAISIADDSGLLAGAVTSFNPSDWTSVTEITISYTGTIDWRVGIDNVGFTLAAAPCTMTVSITAQSNVLCNGAATGQLTVSQTDGEANFNYLWSNASSTSNSTASNTITNLEAGTYTVTVTDNNSCTATASSTITEPLPLLANHPVSNNVRIIPGNWGGWLNSSSQVVESNPSDLVFTGVTGQATNYRS